MSETSEPGPALTAATGAARGRTQDDGADMRARAMAALRLGVFDLAEEAIARGDATLAELVENLRIYQIELQMQAEELQRSQARTQQALDRFTLLFARLPVPALLIDANGVVLESNQRAEQAFGVNTAMMRGYLFHRLVDADDYQAEVRGALLDARSAGQAEVAAVRFRAAGGTQIVGDLHVEALTDPVSGLLQYACVMIDRTEQLADYETLQATVARLRAREDEAAHAAAPARPVLLLADPAGRVLWSEAALDVAPGSMLGARVADPKPLAAALADGSMTWIGLTDSAGQMRTIALWPARDAAGEVLQYLGTEADPARAR
jgi:PAS domain S-box-containing protein